MNAIKIKCLGASKEVGRSGFLIEDENTRILLDYGVKLSDEQNYFPLPVKGYIDGIILSHGHIDHSGGLPLLYRKSECPCYMLPETVPIIQLLLKDSLKIAGLNNFPIGFEEQHVKRLTKSAFPVDYNKKRKISDWNFEFKDAGHVLGAAITFMESNKMSIVYSGDFKGEDTQLHKKADWHKKDHDVLILESTYGDRDHPKRKEIEKEFIDACKEVLDSDGNVLLPAFALGRSQELITILNDYKIDYPIYIDGMAKDICEITLDHVNRLRDPDSFIKACNKAVWVASSSQRANALKEPSVIVTTSGMLEGGPIANYLVKAKNKKNVSIFITGYQVDGTPGKILLETKHYITDEGDLNLSHCNIRKWDFSAHAGQNELIEAAKKTNPKLIIIVHGEPEKSAVLKKKIEDETGYTCVIPSFGEEVQPSDYF